MRADFQDDATRRATRKEALDADARRRNGRGLDACPRRIDDIHATLAIA
jgi:hypothetical protein